MTATNGTATRIMVVDDERVQMLALSTVLDAEGYCVSGFTDAREALASLSHTRYDLLLADLIMPAMGGIALIEAAMRVAPRMGCVVISGAATIPSAIAALRAGALDYVLKPFDLATLSITLRRAVQMCDLRLAKEDAELSLRASVDQLSAANRELSAAQALASQANEAKSIFLASMSHELRTPLNAVIGFAHILASSTLTTTAVQRQHFSNNILSSAKHLLVLINEVLDLAKLESRAVEGSLETVTIRNLVDECLTMMSPLCTERNIQPRFSLERDVAVVANRLWLKQVLLNLLSNAVKYNRPDGHIVVAAGEGTRGAIRISVSDGGAGIAPAKLSRLFCPFDRLDQELGPEQGTGLGLATAKKLVERMHGAIGVESQVGDGSTFWIELPSALAP